MVSDQVAMSPFSGAVHALPDLPAPRAFNHVGMTVPDIDRAIAWYGAVLGFRLIFRRLLEYRPEVPEVREIFGPRFGSAHQAHLLTANGVGLELFEFIEPMVEKPDDNFRYWQIGIFHICVTDPDLEGLVARVLARWRQAAVAHPRLPDRPAMPARLLRGPVRQHRRGLLAFLCRDLRQHAGMDGANTLIRHAIAPPGAVCPPGYRIVV